MRYTNGDTTQRIADITVNGVTQKIAFVPTASGQITNVASITVNLNNGAANTLKIAGSNGGYGTLSNLPGFVACNTNGW